jgi:hypothetical protein
MAVAAALEGVDIEAFASGEFSFPLVSGDAR